MALPEEATNPVATLFNQLHPSFERLVVHALRGTVVSLLSQHLDGQVQLAEIEAQLSDELSGSW